MVSKQMVVATQWVSHLVKQVGLFVTLVFNQQYH